MIYLRNVQHYDNRSIEWRPIFSNVDPMHFSRCILYSNVRKRVEQRSFYLNVEIKRDEENRKEMIFTDSRRTAQ